MRLYFPRLETPRAPHALRLKMGARPVRVEPRTLCSESQALPLGLKELLATPHRGLEDMPAGARTFQYCSYLSLYHVE